MCSNDSRQTYKKMLHGRGRNVVEQRTDRRQRLVQKFKSLRIQAVDSLRNLKDTELTYEVLCHLKNEILSTLDNGTLVQEDEVDDVLADLEEELKVLQYERTCAEEIDAIMNNLMNKCDICETLIVEGGICEPCVDTHFTGQF